MRNLILFPIIAALCGCGTLQDIQKALGSPAQVQTELTILGAVAKSHIPASAQAKIHQFAAQLQSAASLDLTQLFALIPSTGSQNGDAIILAAKGVLTSVVQKYGSNNPTSLAYAHAVAAALLANF